MLLFLLTVATYVLNMSDSNYHSGMNWIGVTYNIHTGHLQWV
jgi:hypothetical protein